MLRRIRPTPLFYFNNRIGRSISTPVRILSLVQQVNANNLQSNYQHQYNRSFSSGGHKKQEISSPTTTTATPATEQKVSMAESIRRTTVSIAVGTKDLILHPSKIPALLRGGWVAIKETAEHYWLGTKLLWHEMKLAYAIIQRILHGHSMTRRERMQLIRTTMDMFRLVPFAIFVIVPFMELLLPVALKLFPNMLPSTFTDTLKKEENMKKELQMRLAIAGFFQETVQAMAHEKHHKLQQADRGGGGAQEVIEFFEKVRLGEQLPNALVIKMSQLFKDELTLANIARPQLVSMCQYMGLAPYGADAFLRFQLRAKLRAIKEDDRRILWEGLDSLTAYEVREACQERGMSAFGLTDFEYKRQLREWLDLSIQKSVPISLLIMSRAFTLQSAPDAVPSGDHLRSSLSSLDEEIINEVVLAAARANEEHTLDMKTRKLESIQFQQEMILEEREDTDEARQAFFLQQQQQQLLASTLAENTNLLAADATLQQAASTTTPSPADHPAVPLSASSEVEHKLSLHEMQALTDLVGGAVQREKSELAELRSRSEGALHGRDDDEDMRENHHQLHEAAIASAAASAAKLTGTATSAATTSTNGGSGVGTAGVAAVVLPEDRELQRMKSALNAMLDTLTVRISSTEVLLGDKLKLLDLDMDGELSVVELKTAIAGILKRATTEQEAEELAHLLDKDRDGKVSVAELTRFVEERRERQEVHHLEAQVASSNNKPPATATVVLPTTSVPTTANFDSTTTTTTTTTENNSAQLQQQPAKQ